MTENQQENEIELTDEQKEELKKFVGSQVFATATASLQAEIDKELGIVTNTELGT